MRDSGLRLKQPALVRGRLLCFAPDAITAGWVERQASELGLHVQQARTVAEVVRALVDEPPPRAQILVADFDALNARDVLQLHAIRERGWFGSLIALGDVAVELVVSLNIECVLKRPLGSEPLRRAIAQVGIDRPTAKMPKLKLR